MPEVENSQSKIFAQPLAVGLGVALLLGYVLITGYAVYEKSHRASIEHVDYANAVGDRAYFSRTLDPALPLVNFDGHSLYFVEQKDLMDSSMTRAGMDDSKAYAIYKPASAKGDDAAFVYLKIGPNSYIKAKSR